MTDDLVKRLRDYEEYEQSRDGQIICVKSDMAQEAATYIEQLEAENRELAMQVLASGSQAQEAYEAQLKAEAATAAAYEVAAREADDFVRMREQQIETEKAKDALYINVPRIMRWQAGKVQSKAIADDIRALATPDQTAALDKLIAEAEARVWEKAMEAVRRAARTHNINDRYSAGFEDGICRQNEDDYNAILAASKKGGV